MTNSSPPSRYTLPRGAASVVRRSVELRAQFNGTPVAISNERHRLLGAAPVIQPGASAILATAVFPIVAETLYGARRFHVA
jgi:hypothetical protein